MRYYRRKVILGFDPGTRSIGYGIVVNTGGRLSASNAGLLLDPKRKSLRYRDIERAAEFLLKRHRPDLIAVERTYFAKNEKTALMVGEVTGILKLVAERNGIPVMELSPTAVKAALTASGRASKTQMAKMARILLDLGSKTFPHHATDALAIAIAAEREPVGRD